MSSRIPLSILIAGSAAACVTPEPTTIVEEETGSPAYVSRGDKWPNSMNIPVCWESGGWSHSKQWVRAYIEKTYETLGDFQVDFTGWGTCSSGSDGIRIQIADDTPRTQGLGTELDGNGNGLRLNFTFNNWSPSCASPRNNNLFCIAAIAGHEFGHALGLAHEQNRPDTPEWCDQEQGSDGDATIGAWDIDSIMNYCGDWNNNGILSYGDIAGLRDLYQASKGKSVFSRDVASHIIELYGNNSGWVWNDLSAMTGAAPAIAPPETTYHRGAQHVFYRGSSGSIHQIWWIPSPGWSYYALSAGIPGAVAAAGNPKPVGILDYMHVFYRGTDGHVHQFFHNGASWSRHDVSAMAGAPATANAAADLAVYTMANSVHIIYRGTDNHVHSLDWEIDRGWRHTNLTQPISARQAVGTPTAMAIGFFQFVYYRGTDNHIYQLKNNYMDGDSWTSLDVFTRVTGEVNAASDPVAHNRSEYINVFYRGSDNHVHELFFDPAGTWFHTDLTVLTGAPVTWNRPTSVVNGTSQHVFFGGGSGGQVYELYHTPSAGWNRYALGAAEGAPGPVGTIAAHIH